MSVNAMLVNAESVGQHVEDVNAPVMASAQEKHWKEAVVVKKDIQKQSD